MTDIVGNARSAREMLARGLNALQADPNAPPEYLNAAEPIAMAMGALHRIERRAGADLASAAPQALESVRAALALLQTRAAADPRFSPVLEEVAGSLGMVFALNKAASYGPAPQPAAPAAAPYAPPQPAQQPYAPPPAAQPMRPAVPQQMGVQPQQAPAYAPPQPAQQPYAQPAHQAAPWAQQQQGPYAPPQQAPAYAPPQQQAPYAPPQQAPAYAPPQQQAPYAPPQQAPAYAPPQQPPQAAPQAWAPPQQQAPQPAPQQPAGYRDGAKLPLVEAELGTHSVSNFYRGLSGNDIVESGGIFVSTYNIPEIGQQLRVRVSLPGGLEFEAIGVVRWVREARESMASDISPPGFGLQFTNISAEGRNLIYRYVRNREPMFHDDL